MGWIMSIGNIKSLAQTVMCLFCREVVAQTSDAGHWESHSACGFSKMLIK